MVSGPAEQVLSQITGVEHVMSVSQPGMSVVTVQYKVGVPRTEAWCVCMTPSTRTPIGCPKAWA